jgi:predicted Zn finger-like uncharacterized protein
VKKEKIMLISCPKCHCIYEIPDEIIKKTGTNLRCHACHNVWHAMREDALDYHAEDEDEPYVEPIEVSEPPYRHFPANKENYTIPADSKSGVKTRSSAEVKKQESREKEEITLTSDFGTSFTISAAPELKADDESKKTPWLEANEAKDVRAQKEDMIRPQKSCRGYRKTCVMLWLLLIVLLAVFLRRDIVTMYPDAETWYNKIYLSGLNNAQYLRFENVSLTSEIMDGEEKLHLKAEIVNTSRYNSFVPEIALNGVEGTFKADRDFIKAKEKAIVDIALPKFDDNTNQGLTLEFVHP